MILNISTNNLAKTAFQFFESALLEYAVPGMIRVDGGGEFNHNERFMNSLDGQIRCLRGKSVHNVRIERLWRDCREKVLDKYITLFEYMERSNILDIQNDIHLYALHYVFLRRILRDLRHWQMAHNNHPIRGEKNKTPVQLWLSGALNNRHVRASAMQNLFFQSKQEREELIRAFVERQQWEEPSNIRHVLSRVPAPLSIPEIERMVNLIDPLAHSDCNGIDIYGSVVNYILACINQE